MEKCLRSGGTKLCAQLEMEDPRRPPKHTDNTLYIYIDMCVYYRDIQEYFDKQKKDMESERKCQVRAIVCDRAPADESDACQNIYHLTNISIALGPPVDDKG